MTRIDFNESRHEYRADGVIVPSVSRILEPLNGLSGIPEGILQAASLRGTDVHTACDFFDDGTLDMETVDHTVRPYLDAWIAFRKECGSRVIASEQVVFHSKLRYAGRLDRIVEIDGKKIILDIKTTSAMKPAHGCQVYAYRAALSDMGVKTDGAACVYLHFDGTWTFKEYNEAIYKQGFLACLSLLHFKVWGGINE